jgi:hypothetical protein
VKVKEKKLTSWVNLEIYEGILIKHYER